MGPESVTFLEENIRERLNNIGLNNDCMDMISKAGTIKAKLDIWAYINLKRFWITKKTRVQKGNLQNRKNICKAFG